MLEQIGHYQIKSEIARSSMSVVYHAFDPRFQRDVAIKRLRPQFPYNDQEIKKRFNREIRTMAALDHTAIVTVYDVNVEDNQPYLVMQFMQGGSLADKIKRSTLSLMEVVSILERIAPALDEAHQRGFIHRDVKPSNILFDQRGAAHLSDFGIAKLTSSREHLTETNSFIGTVAYMSPEQALGQTEIDGRTDLYALGVVVFEALFGKLPFDSDTPFGLMLARLTHPVPRLAGADARYQTWFDVALAMESDERFDSAEQLTQQLRTHSATPPPPIASPIAKPQRGWTGIVIAILLLFGIVFGSSLITDAPPRLTTPTPTEAVAAVDTKTSLSPEPTATITPSPTARPFTPTPTNTPRPTLTPTTTSTPTPTQTHTPTPTQPTPVVSTPDSRYEFVEVRRYENLNLEKQEIYNLSRTSGEFSYLLQFNKAASFLVDADMPMIGIWVESVDSGEGVFLPAELSTEMAEIRQLDEDICGEDIPSCIIWDFEIGTQTRAVIKANVIPLNLGDVVEIWPAFEKCSNCERVLGNESYRFLLSD